MTAINAVIFSKSGHLFTDAAHYGSIAPELTGVQGKVFRLPHLHAVLAGNGEKAFASLCAGIALQRQDATAMELMANFDAVMEAALNIAQVERIELGKSEIVLLAWDHGPRLLHGGVDHGRVMGSKLIAEALLPSPSDSVAGFGQVDQVEHDGLRIMNEQRRLKDRLGRHVVGGFVNHTILTGDSLTISTVHSWPDAVGRPIEV